MESRPKAEQVYEGEYAQTQSETRQFRCNCGDLAPVELITCVDASDDSELALRATETSLDRALHTISCELCGLEQVVAAPFTYHNGSERIFTLVLPQAWRHRELEERAALLLALAKDSHPIPDYVIQFTVAYGPEGLRDQLRKARAETQSLARDRGRLRDVEDRLEEAAAREARIKGREKELADIISDLDTRSSSLTERELGLRDRKSALDRRSEELERKTAAIEEVQTRLRAESQDELPNLLRKDETEALDIEDILTSAPSPNAKGEVQIPATASVSGSSVKKAPTSPMDTTPDVDSPVPVLKNLQEGETRIAPAAGQRVGRRRAESDIVTGQHPSPRDTEPNLHKVLGLDSEPLSPMTEIGDNEITLPSSTDKEVDDWRKAGGAMLKLLRGREVRLVASVHSAALDELMAGDIRALLQFHRMPSYPLVSLTLARAATLAGRSGSPFSFHFDVGESGDRAALEALAKDFRFTLEIYDGEHKPVRQRRLAAPLAANIRYVMALAADARKGLAPRARSFSGAINAFNNPRHDRLGRGHLLAREFRDSLLDKLSSPTELLAAIAQCERFSEPAGEEYLVAIRSYPFDRWHQRRLEVIKRALELGLWMGAALARVAVSEELVRSRKELVATCRANFASLLEGVPKALSNSQVRANWKALDAEAATLGVSTGRVQSSAEDSVASGEIRRPAKAEAESDSALLAKLEIPASRLQAIVELCRRNTVSSLDPMFRAVAELPVVEAAEAFAAVTGLGNQAAELLLVFLSCPSSHLRHGAALALCELGNDVGVDSICESLMQDEGTMWREYSYALGRVGSAAIMPLVARISPDDKRGQARAVWTLGYIAAGGARKPVETLARGRDVTVAQVAGAGLELEKRLRSSAVPVERNPSEQAFSDDFYRALSGQSMDYASSEMSGPAMVLDDADLMEAID